MSEYLEDWDNAKYCCPSCGSSEGFYEIVSLEGWRSVNVDYLPEEGIPVITEVPNAGYGDREADWVTAYGTGSLGCGECTWEGLEKDLILNVPPRLGWDGKPLDKPIPGQLDLAT